MTDLLTPIQAALALPHAPLPQTQAGALPSTFAVTDRASAQRQRGSAPGLVVVLFVDSPRGVASAAFVGPGSG